jgi:hypothetical protein
MCEFEEKLWDESFRLGYDNQCALIALCMALRLKRTEEHILKDMQEINKILKREPKEGSNLWLMSMALARYGLKWTKVKPHKVERLKSRGRYMMFWEKDHVEAKFNKGREYVYIWAIYKP